MTVLQAFLYTQSFHGPVIPSVHDEQVSVLSTWWTATLLDADATGWLDVGFADRSPQLDGLWPGVGGRLRVTPSARLAVPLLPAAGAGVVSEPRDVCGESDWLNGVRDFDAENPYDVVAAAPSTLLDLELRKLLLTRRTANVFLIAGLVTVRDVMSLGFDGLNKLRNLGEKSIRAFSSSLVAYVESGHLKTGGGMSNAEKTLSSQPLQTRGDEHEIGHRDLPGPPALIRPLRQALLDSLEQLDKRDAAVMNARLGRAGPPRTLEEIGVSLGVSRERARQLEARGRDFIVSRHGWPTVLRGRLNSLLSSRDEPLYLDLIAAEDEGFDGFQDNLAWLAQIIEQFGAGEYHAWELEGRLIASRLAEEKWSVLKNAALIALGEQIETRLTSTEVAVMIEAISSGMGAPELATSLDRCLEPLLHFARTPGTAPRLVAVGRGIRHAIISIFEESDRPLHFREVRERLSGRGYAAPNLTSLRSAIRTSGMLLFGRSVYGTRAHIGLEPETLEEIRGELVEIINETPSHQWHAAELVDELQRREVGQVDGIDRYTIGAILDGSTDVAYLGRLVWAAKNRRGLSTRDRRDVAQLVEAALLRAGRPMAKRELRLAIEEARGLNVHFLPQPSDRVIRLGNGQWGLVERDCRMSTEETEDVLRLLESILFKRGRALHPTEVAAALAERGATLPEWASDEVMGRAQIDPRFRIARGGYVALPIWSSLGRVTLSEALEQVLGDWNGPATTEEVHDRIEVLTERPIHRWHVVTWLNRVALLRDSSSGVWDKPVDGDESDSADDNT